MIGHSILRTAPRSSTVVVVDGRVAVSRPSRTLVIQAPAGLPGPQGPPGPPGSGGAGTGYTHNQVLASSVWTINHGLGYRPAVTSYDTASDQIMGEVDHIDANNLTITFSSAISGTAYMS